MMRKKKQIWDFKSNLVEDSKAPPIYNIVVREKDILALDSTKNILNKFLNFEVSNTACVKEIASPSNINEVNCELAFGFYTRDIAETKLKEITEFIVSNKIQINLGIKKIKRS